MKRSALGLFACSLLLSVAPATASSGNRSSFHFPKPATANLDNGLMIVVEEDHHAPLVAMNLRYEAGSRDDGAGHEGLSLLVQQMMLQRTKHVPEGDYRRTLERIGANHTWEWAGDDAMGVATVVPSNAVETVLWLWSDQMAFFAPTVDDASLTKPRKVVEGQLRARFEAVPYGRAHALSLDALYPEKHPYHTASSGRLAKATASDVTSFVDAHMAPNNAILVVSGDIDISHATRLAKRYFGAISGGPDANRPPPPAVSLAGETQLDVAANVDAPKIEMTWPTPAQYAKGDAELDVFARLLRGAHTSFLSWGVMATKNLAVDVTAWQSSHELGSEFTITVTGAPGRTAQELVVAVDDVLAKLAGAQLDQGRVERAAVEYLLPKVFRFEENDTRALNYGMYEQFTGDSGFLEDDLLRYAHPTSASVQETVRRYIDPRRRILTMVNVDPNAPACGVLRGTSFVPATKGAVAP